MPPITAMLRWRLPLGLSIVALLVLLGWLDHLAETRGEMRGAWSWPVAVFFTVTASAEVLRLARAGGLHPLPWVVYGGNLLLVASNWLLLVCGGGAATGSPLAAGLWPMVTLAMVMLVVFVAEMVRYRRPGGVTADIAATTLALVYVGVMLSFVVQLRMIWGVGAAASLLIVVKVGDTGAFAVGRLFGRHKLAPTISPGKTIEGVLGALVFACAASWATFRWLVPLSTPESIAAGPWHGWLAFGLLVGAAGVVGDLAESLLKRDVGVKDSSDWLPGFGGVLDILDSILLGAPVAWLCWALGLVGR